MEISDLAKVQLGRIAEKLAGVQKDLSCGMIDNADAKEEIMNLTQKQRALRRKEAERVHKGNVRPPSREGGYWNTYVGGQRVYARSEDELYEKVFVLYFGEDATCVTLSVLFEMYQEYRRSLGTYCRTMEIDDLAWRRCWGRAPIAEKDVATISPKEVRDALAIFVGDGKVTKKDAGGVVSLLRRMYAFAADQEITSQSPVPAKMPPYLRFKTSANSANRRKNYTKEEVERLRTVLLSKPLTSYWGAILLKTVVPLRIGELIALTWDDVDFGARELRIWHSIVYASDHGRKQVALDVPHVKTRTEAGVRSVAVPADGMEVLSRMRSVTGRCDYVFANKSGSAPIFKGEFNDHLKCACKEAGIPYYPSHILRFYVATRMFEEGIPVQVISEQLGHSNLAQTFHYLRFAGSGGGEFEEIIRNYPHF